MSLRLEIPHLRAFVTVARLQSFTRAAETLNLTQSAVSWQVRRLEERIGRTLLSRGTTAIGLTPHGRDFLADAMRVLSAHDQAIDSLRRSDLAGRVRFGCAEDLIAERLSDVLSRFQRLHPGVRLEVVVDASLVLKRRVESGDLDSAIVQQEAGGPAGQFLWREQPLWVGAPDARIGEERPLPLVTFGKDCVYRAAAAAALEAAGIDWYPVLECSSVAGVRAAVAAGIGVGVLAERHFDNATPPLVELTSLPLLSENDFILLGGKANAALAALTELMLQKLRPRMDGAPSSHRWASTALCPTST